MGNGEGDREVKRATRSGIEKKLRSIDGGSGKGTERMRSKSCGSLKKMWKRKTEESMEKLEGEKKNAFRRSKKTIRSPKVEKKVKK